MISFEEVVQTLAGELAYRRSLEKQLKEMTTERNYWREKAEPGWDARELRQAIDGEIRLMREQG